MTEFKKYIVTLKDNATDKELLKRKIHEMGGSITSEFSLINGFVAKLKPHHATEVKAHNDVANIEEDKEVHTQ